MIRRALNNKLRVRYKVAIATTMACVVGLWAALAGAVVDVDQLSTRQLSERYHHLVEEYRCPKCQNQNLAESDSPISADLRKQIRRMLEEGASDEAISDYLVARYGDFVLYRPRLQQGTYLLWVAPVVLLSIGVLVVGVVVSRRRAQPLAAGEHELGLNVAEQARVNRLLAGSSDGVTRASEGEPR